MGKVNAFYPQTTQIVQIFKRLFNLCKLANHMTLLFLEVVE